jgi:LysM repeat protein
LLVKSGLDNGSSSQTDTATVPTSSATATRATTTKLVLTTPSAATTATTTASTTAAGQYYVIQAGDTLGAIAAKYSTNVDQLLTWNPGLDPSALQPGTRIRVG